MYLEQLHENGACSSLMLWCLSDFEGAPDRFIKTLWNLLNEELEETDTLNEGTYPKDMSFCVASTVAAQITANKMLNELGFTPHGPVYNKKNNTSPTLWVIGIPTLLEQTKKFIASPELLNSSEVKGI